MKNKFLTHKILLSALFLLMILAFPNKAFANVTGTYKGHTYKIFTQQKTPPSAEKYCEKLGGHLATITSAEEQKYVAKLAKKITNYEDFIIGGTDKNKEGTWEWLNGETWSYSNWYDGSIYGLWCSEPNNGLGSGEDYLTMNAPRNYMWVDCYGGYDDYTTAHYFVCEWDYSIKTAESTLNLKPGKSAYIKASMIGKTAKTFTFKSSNTSVAKVSSKGKVVAKNGGYCKITVTAKNVSKTVWVYVTPRKVSGLKKKSATKNSVTVKWTKTAGASKYQVSYYDRDLEEYVTKTVKGSKTTYTIKGLDKNTSYKIKVRAVLKRGSVKKYGSYSATIKAKTKK